MHSSPNSAKYVSVVNNTLPCSFVGQTNELNEACYCRPLKYTKKMLAKVTADLSHRILGCHTQSLAASK